MEGVKVEEEESEEAEEVKEVDGTNRGRENFFSRFRSLCFNFASFSEESSPDSFEEFPEESSCST